MATGGIQRLILISNSLKGKNKPSRYSSMESIKSAISVSDEHSQKTRSTFFSYYPVYIVIMICNQRKLIAHKAK